MENKMQIVDSGTFFVLKKTPSAKKWNTQLGIPSSKMKPDFLFLTFDRLRSEEIMGNGLDTWAQVLDVIDGALKIL